MVIDRAELIETLEAEWNKSRRTPESRAELAKHYAEHGVLVEWRLDRDDGWIFYATLTEGRA
jgi:hypothetical protein